MTNHEESAFSDWLNEIDARYDYDLRRKTPLVEWYHLFKLEYTAKDAGHYVLSRIGQV